MKPASELENIIRLNIQKKIAEYIYPFHYTWLEPHRNIRSAMNNQITEFGIRVERIIILQS